MAPYAQFQRGTVALLRLRAADFQQGLTHALSLTGMQHADVVHIQAIVIHAGAVVAVAEHPAEGIADYLARCILRNQVDILVLAQALRKFLWGKIAGFDSEKIRPAGVMKFGNFLLQRANNCVPGQWLRQGEW